MNKETVLKIAHTFIGYEDSEEYFSTDRLSIQGLAEQVGINLIQTEEGMKDSVVVINGTATIAADIASMTEYELALLIASYILFNRLTYKLTTEESMYTSMFAVTTIIPDIMHYTDVSLDTLIRTSQESGIPFPALRAIFEEQ